MLPIFTKLHFNTCHISDANSLFKTTILSKIVKSGHFGSFVENWQPLNCQISFTTSVCEKKFYSRSCIMSGYKNLHNQHVGKYNRYLEYPWYEETSEGAMDNFGSSVLEGRTSGECLSVAVPWVNVPLAA